jgi:hypothetical protein
MVFDHAGKRLYVSTSDGTVVAYDPTSAKAVATYTLGSSLNGIDVAADDSFLIVAENSIGITQGTFYRLDLTNGSVTNINYTRASNEGGAWDVAIGSNGLALITTRFQGSGWVPLRQINLTNNAVTIRSDAPGSGFNGQVTQDTRLHRSADGTRLYLLESNISSGPLFTYNAVTNTFGAKVQMQTLLDRAGAAVNRNGSILGTRVNDYPYFGATNTSLDGAASFAFLHSFSGMNAGVAFDATKDIFYTIGNGGTQVIAFDTNTFAESFRLDIGESVTGNVTPFGTGSLVASGDGRYLALATASGIRLIDVTNTLPPAAAVFASPRDMVFDHAGNYLYLATYNGLVWPFNLLTYQLETPFDCGGSLNGIDIAPDDSYLLVAQAVTGLAQGAFQKIDIGTHGLTNLTYTRAGGEAGGWAVEITSNGRAFGSTDYAGSGWVPLHEINLASGIVSTRGDAPGSGSGGGVRNRTQIHRSANGSRLYLLETDSSSGPLFTYNATTNSFGANAQTGISLTNTSAAVNRTGSLLGTRFGGQSSASLDTAPDFNFVHSFSGLDSGVAFDAIKDRFYGVNSASDQIIAYDTNTFAQKLALQIGENVGPGTSMFGPGTLIASGDGRYLALQTSTAIRIYPVPPGGAGLQITRSARLPNGHFIVQGFAAPNSSNSIQATSSLQSAFTTIATTMSDANGAIQFEDNDAVNYAARFYRITSP